MIGKTLDGYNIIDFIGKGQFGTVYKCENSNGLFAMKIFNSDYVLEEYRRNEKDNRITREIKAMSIVDNDNVVKLMDSGSFSENRNEYYYIVMEYIEGEDLSKYIKHNVLNIDEILEIFIQILDGLDAIHSKGIVHRDLKPQNILITKDKTIKLLDFGLSKLIDYTSLTSTGDNLGSPLYMSPEQIKDSKNIDYRSDYYALGVILFELITKKSPYGNITSREHLYYKILNEPPYSVIQYEPLVPNYCDKLIVNLMKKMNYERPNSKKDILNLMDIGQSDNKSESVKELKSQFYFRTWNEKRIVEDYYTDKNIISNIIFPINHQNRQKGLLNFIKNKNINYFFDPSTMRLAYDSFSNVKGLTELEYAPKNFSRLELDNFEEYDDKKKYVKLVVEEQNKHNPDCIVAPFHFSNNSNMITLKNSGEETWFSLDIKLLKETKEYMNDNNINKPLIGGFAIKKEILSSKKEREYFLNILTALPCDKYWVYVDCIDYNSSAADIYQYMSTLLKLQSFTGKPVIAGRIGTLGLVLLAFGLHGFESGAARFESFYEDLYQKESNPFNMYVQYYIPELLRNVSVERKNPAKIISILSSKYGEDLKCNCPYCNKNIAALTSEEGETRKHFLFKREEEVKYLNSIPIVQRVDYIEERIDKAMIYYKSLKPIFKENEYAFLKNWKKVVKQLRKDYNI